VRIEDLDTPRIIPGCADRILHALEAFGLNWDGAVSYQSNRFERYSAALDQLNSYGLVYECSCSRRDLAGQNDTGYVGTCRDRATHAGLTATRFRVDDSGVVSFDDRVQGRCGFGLGALGDFIVRRKDGIISYQLAVVVDDAEQGVTDVVRGADLLPSTAWQIALQQTLRLASPRYAHLPVVIGKAQEKLSKSRQSLAVGPDSAGRELRLALRLLNHPPPPELDMAPPAAVLEWASGAWNLDAFHRARTVTVPTPLD
jgi:glutamyl-Q tRNA(Asp) synthetase